MTFATRRHDFATRDDNFRRPKPKYTDPSGEFYWALVGALFSTYDNNIGAYSTKADFSFGGSFYGIKYNSTYTGSLYSAHAGLTGGFYLNLKNQTLTFTGGEHIGFILGEGFSANIIIPVGWWLNKL